MKSITWSTLACLVSAVSLLLASAAEAAVDVKALEASLRKAASYGDGDDRADLEKIELIVKAAEGNPADATQVEKRLLIILKGMKTTTACRQFICEQLRAVGSAASVPMLARMIKLEKFAEMGLNALGGIEGEPASAALRKAVTDAHPSVKSGVIKAIGERRDTKAIAIIAPLVENDDDDIATAAVQALGQIGGATALKTIKDRIINGSGDVRTAAIEALVTLGKTRAEAGSKAEAAAVFEYACKVKDVEGTIRAEALAGLVATDPAKATTFVLQDLESPDKATFSAALEFVKTIPGDEATETFSAALDAADASRKADLFAAVASRGGPILVSAIRKALVSSDDAMKTAAITAAAGSGDLSLVAPLLDIAKGTDPAAVAASDALIKFSSDNANNELAKHLDKPAVFNILDQRKAVEVLPKIYTALATKTFVNRNPATELIGKLAPAEDFPKLVDLLASGNQLGDDATSFLALEQVSARVTDPAKRDAPVLKALSKTSSSRTRAAMLKLLAKGGSKEALKVIREGVKAKGSSNRDAAVRAMLEWPNDEVLPDLLDIAKTSKNSTHKTLAFRAYLAKATTIKQLQVGMKTSKIRTAEKRIILESLGRMKDPAALDMALSYLEARETKTDASNAIIALAENLGSEKKTEVTAALQKVLEAVKGSSLESKAKAALEKVSK